MAGLSRYRAELTSPPSDPSDRPRHPGERLSLDPTDEPGLPLHVGMDVVRVHGREALLEVPVAGGVRRVGSEPVAEGEMPPFERAPGRAEMHVEASLAIQVAT